MPKSRRRVVCLSDLHVGSRWGLWPADFETADGHPIPPSPEQRMLLNFWEDFELFAKGADTVILAGDICQGNNRKAWGQGTVTPDLEEQVQAAVALLEPLCRGRKVFGVLATQYHDSLDTSLDHAVIRALGGKFLRATGDILLEGPDKVVRVFHGGASPWMYRGGYLDKQSQLLDAAIGRGDIPHKIDAVVSGHWHAFDCLVKPHRTLMKLPGWQYKLEWRKITDFPYVRHIGGVIFDVAAEGIVVTPRLYAEIRETVRLERG